MASWPPSRRPETSRRQPPAAVLRAWAGLGYNRRAINLQRAARAICAGHAGRVPPAVADLECLPGVGGYTARAVAAIAYGVPVAPVDTNVRRVLGRVLAGHGWSGDAGTPLHVVELQGRADGLVDRRAPAAWTHALMDIGATICRPRAPDCGTCPLAAGCRYARAAGAATAARRGGAASQDGRGASAAAANGTATEPGRRRAASGGPPRAAPAAPFPATRRWLRGRIIDRLRSADDDGWVRLDGPIGSHGSADVATAIVALERDGLLERGPDGRVRLPSTAP